MPRENLPNRRRQLVTSIDFRSGYTLSVGFRHDGRPAEVFIDSHKRSSSADTDARDTAILMSLVMQHGAGIEVMRGALSRDASGAAAGLAGVVADALAEIGNLPALAPESIEP